MKIIKNIFISLFTAIITLGIIYGGYTIYAQSSFTGLQNSYHISMNSFFNTKFADMADILDDSDTPFYENENFNAPENSEDCGDDNIGTYCVSIKALDLYLEYVRSLNALKGSIDDVKSDATSMDMMLQIMSNRNMDIDQEILNAKIVLEATISAYNEFKLAYPMHEQYQKVISNLAQYQIALQKIRRQVREFPLRFIDATSSQCE